VPKITPFLWFDSQAEEAANFYCSIFPNSKIGKIARYGKAGPGPEGSVLTIVFSLDGQEFTGLNAGPHFKFTEAISFVVPCNTQDEIDNYWSKLTAGAARKVSAVGSRTNSVSFGKSFPPLWVNS